MCCFRRRPSGERVARALVARAGQNESIRTSSLIVCLLTSDLSVPQGHGLHSDLWYTTMPDTPDQDFRSQMAGIYPSASSSARSNEPTSGTDWLRNGTGRSPSLRWSYQTEAPLVSLRLARETGELLAVDASGSLYVLDPDGKLLAMGQGRAAVSDVAWSDTGAGGIAAVDCKLVWFDRR